jgi:hypothetical protein
LRIAAQDAEHRDASLLRITVDDSRQNFPHAVYLRNGTLLRARATSNALLASEIIYAFIMNLNARSSVLTASHLAAQSIAARAGYHFPSPARGFLIIAFMADFVGIDRYGDRRRTDCVVYRLSKQEKEHDDQDKIDTSIQWRTTRSIRPTKP